MTLTVTDVLGLCLEKLPPLTSRYKQAEREELIIQCFERSGDLSLLQLQERQERGAKATTAVAIQSSGMWNIMDSDTVGVGPIVETAIQRSPILYIRNGYDLAENLRISNLGISLCFFIFIVCFQLLHGPLFYEVTNLNF